MLAQPVGENGRRGAILNMGSVPRRLSRTRHFATHAYAASKAAIVGLSRSMAAYYAPHKIRVNVPRARPRPHPDEPPCPDRPRNPNIDEDPNSPRRKPPRTPKPFARAAVFLLSDDAAFITGQVLDVDGGWNVS
jgi:NAD(P)-dependent dehydrogenase (short-subunit alcohol dehydrogenase family)